MKALLVTAHQHAKPLNSIASQSEGSLTEGIVWTSLMSGHDYKIRQDGDGVWREKRQCPMFGEEHWYSYNDARDAFGRV